MNAQGPIAKAATIPAGAVFHRCALQVNPYKYAEQFRGQKSDGDARSHAEAMITKASETNISVLAITDHNDMSDVPLFQAAATDSDVTIFPGFELTSTEGIHVLCIYPPDSVQDQLGRFLGEFGIREIGSSSELSSKSFEGILRKVREQGGISVAAHVTHDKGLLSVLTGQSRINAWRSQDLLAIQIPGSVKELTENFRPIVEGRNPTYSRPIPAGKRQAVAVINAKDIVYPDQLDHPAATCWIKMSEVSIEGLRQAFLDPDSRIRLNSDSEPDNHAELLSLAWEGGFLDGADVHWNTNLNVLIGGRGAGKSTVIESLRYVLALDPIGEDATKAHRGIVRQVLRSGTRVSLRARCVRPAQREYLIQRTVPNPPVIREDNGRVSNLLPEDILPRVEVYGQHEISELTKSREKLTRLLDRFVDSDPTVARRKVDTCRDLEQTRTGAVRCARGTQRNRGTIGGVAGYRRDAQTLRGSRPRRAVTRTESTRSRRTVCSIRFPSGYRCSGSVWRHWSKSCRSTWYFCRRRPLEICPAERFSRPGMRC